MEVQTIQKYIHTSPRKLQLVADVVRKMNPKEALRVLKFTQKAAAEPLSKAIQTALANANQQKLDLDNLAFKKLEINQSVALKRGQPGSRGRMNPFKRKMSHIRIVLSDDVKIKSQNSKGKITSRKLKEEQEENSGTKN